MKKQTASKFWKEYIKREKEEYDLWVKSKIEEGFVKCPFCTKWMKGETNQKKHVALCWHNPKNKTCFTCQNYKYKSRGSVCLVDPDFYEKKFDCLKHVKKVKYESE